MCCSIACAVKAERRQQRAARADATLSASRQRRFCHICGRQIAAERLRRWHNAKTCGDACSVAIRAAQKRAAITRYRRHLSQRRAQERAAALDTTALCAVCAGEIPVERRVRWPHVRTCRPGAGTGTVNALPPPSRQMRTRRSESGPGSAVGNVGQFFPCRGPSRMVGHSRYSGLDGVPLPLSGMANCPAHRSLDDGVSKILGLPNLGKLRDLLASEPVVSNRRL